MGNKNSNSHKLPTHNWIPIQKDQINMNQSRMTFAQNSPKPDNLYKNENSQEYAQKYQINARQYISLEEEMEIYYYRYMTKKPLVKVYEVKSEKGKGFCSNEEHLEVYQEFIPYRLADVRNLPHDTGLYILSQALFGFEELFSKIGSIPVDQHLIGFNNQGKAKVWYNQNFASNRNPLDGIILMGLNSSNLDKKMTQNQEYDMVEDIWLAINKFSLFNQQFKKQSGQFVECTFSRARSIVQNQIKKRVSVPDRVRFKQSIISRQTTNQQIVQKPFINQSRSRNVQNVSNYNNVNQNNFNKKQCEIQYETKQQKNQIIKNKQEMQKNNNIGNSHSVIQNSRVRSRIFQNGYNQNFNRRLQEQNSQIPQSYYLHNQQPTHINFNNNLTNLYPLEYSTKYY